MTRPLGPDYPERQIATGAGRSQNLERRPPPYPLSSTGHPKHWQRYGLDLGPVYRNGLWNGASGSDYVTVESAVPWSTATDTAANAPYGAYIELVGQNSYLVLGFPLGPRGSVWKFSPVFSAGPDCGIVTIELQTQPSSYNGATAWPVKPVNLGSDTNWWHSTIVGVAYYETDCYAAGASVFDTDDTAIPNIYVNGDDTTMVTANPSVFFYTNTAEWLGGGDGSVWWWLRMKTKTKNPSSSGYTMRLHGYSMTRIADDLITPS